LIDAPPNAQNTAMIRATAKIANLGGGVEPKEGRSPRRALELDDGLILLDKKSNAKNE
jgi:hypothetical protein